MLKKSLEKVHLKKSSSRHVWIGFKIVHLMAYLTFSSENSLFSYNNLKKSYKVIFQKELIILPSNSFGLHSA
jgi:hypothetical protein